MRFGEKVILLMAQVGETLGISQTTVGRWINGARPRPEVIAGISAIFGVPIEILLDAEVNLTPQNQQDFSIVGATDSCSEASMELVEKWRSLLEK